MSKVWDRATEFLGDNIALVTPIALLAIFLPTSINDNLAPLGNDPASTASLAISLVWLVTSLCSLFGQAAITALALDDTKTAGDAIGTALGRLLPLLLVLVLTLLLLALAGLPVGIALGMSGLDLAAMEGGNQAAIAAQLSKMTRPTAIFILIYTLAWFVFSIWVCARLALTTPVVIAERLGLGAMLRSFRLTGGMAIKIVGVLILYVIVSGVAILAAKAVVGSVLGVILGPAEPLNLAGVLTSIAVGVAATIFSVLSAAFIAKLYIAARDRAEQGADLA